MQPESPLSPSFFSDKTQVPLGSESSIGVILRVVGIYLNPFQRRTEDNVFAQANSATIVYTNRSNNDNQYAAVDLLLVLEEQTHMLTER